MAEKSLFLFCVIISKWAKSGQQASDKLSKTLKVVIKKSGHLCKNIITNFIQLNKMNRLLYFRKSEIRRISSHLFKDNIFHTIYDFIIINSVELLKNFPDI